MNATVTPFRPDKLRDRDSLSHGTVYVFFDRPAPRKRKCWGVITEFRDWTYDMDLSPSDWKTAMAAARGLARKYGFRVVDLSEAMGGAK
jgi:hypothetical protein